MPARAPCGVAHHGQPLEIHILVKALAAFLPLYPSQKREMLSMQGSRICRFDCRLPLVTSDDDDTENETKWRRMNGWMEGGRDGWGWVGGQVGGWMDGWMGMDGWMDGWMDGDDDHYDGGSDDGGDTEEDDAVEAT